MGKLRVDVPGLTVDVEFETEEDISPGLRDALAELAEAAHEAHLEMAEVDGFGRRGLVIGDLGLKEAPMEISRVSSCWGYGDGHCTWFYEDEGKIPDSCTFYTMGVKGK